ncbi:S-adenosyl-l-methionine hydroxide adenosyltransferase family protein [Frankia sp. R43]|uniref:SAM hydrolase/SAM-dependent halogenase family protein n=1 Tax=Frankia sp. R43 TaxID=269536 RepID=UPI0009F87291|nr:SAM-dependent chlorinase/fluorinase [Frankia sp. R43]
MGASREHERAGGREHERAEGDERVPGDERAVDDPRCVSLLTDYGLVDGFVAACHGVLLRLAPAVPIIDVTHLVPRGDIRRGATVLASTVAHLPRGVHVAVVDPGVGTARRALALRTPAGFLVGPDNGLLVPAAEVLGGVLEAVALTVPADVPATFHGRDVFAPAAAALVAGRPLRALGLVVDPESLVTLPRLVARVAPAGPDGAARLESDVLCVDGFGNVALAAPADLLAELGLRPGDRSRLTALRGTGPASGGASAAPAARPATDSAAGPPVVAVEAIAVEVAVGVTFGSVEPGELVLYADSDGHAALATRDGDAARALRLGPGDRVVITPA